MSYSLDKNWNFLTTLTNNKPYYCYACGGYVERWSVRDIISDELADCWRLDVKLRKKFDLRESSFCPRCHNSLRTRSLAQAIIREIPLGSARSLRSWVGLANRKGLSVAEINSCGSLHPILARLTNLHYSEYVEGLKLMTRLRHLIHGVETQDMMYLSYPDDRFDLVIHSEVLEHVSDYKRAIGECRRILKPGGKCIFTVPLIWGRKTISRRGKRASFHGSGEDDNLVYWEFGSDLVSKERLKLIYSDKRGENYVLGFEKN